MIENNSNQNSGNNKIYGGHPSFASLELQRSFDNYFLNKMGGLLSAEESGRRRTALMVRLLHYLEYYRKSKGDESLFEKSRELAETLTSEIHLFNSEFWPEIQHIHEGVITNHDYPFKDIHDVSSILNLSSDDIADITDRMREIISHEQVAISQLTRDVAKLAATNEMVVGMARKRRTEETTTMVRNQRIS